MCTYACGIWHLTCGLVNVSEIPDWLFFAFMKNCLSMVIVSRIWDVVIILFLWSIWWLNTINIGISLHLLRWLSIICADMVIPIFACAVRFNPWYVDFISGPSSCENQPWFSWLIVELLLHLQVKIGLIWNLLLVAYSILLVCYVLRPSLKLW